MRLTHNFHSCPLTQWLTYCYITIKVYVQELLNPTCTQSCMYDIRSCSIHIRMNLYGETKEQWSTYIHISIRDFNKHVTVIVFSVHKLVIRPVSDLVRAIMLSVMQLNWSLFWIFMYSLFILLVSLDHLEQFSDSYFLFWELLSRLIFTCQDLILLTNNYIIFCRLKTERLRLLISLSVQ